jgi:hypothetical protein
MNNLRASNCICHEEILEYEQSSILSVDEEDNLVQRLQDYLWSSCMITRDNHDTQIIRLWIR